MAKESEDSVGSIESSQNLAEKFYNIRWGLKRHGSKRGKYDSIVPCKRVHVQRFGWGDDYKFLVITRDFVHDKVPIQQAILE